MDEQEAQPITDISISDRQEIVRIVLRICSASLSAVGSSTIIFKILRDRTHNGSITPYDRIVLLLSSWDVFASITWILTIFLVRDRTEAACQISGFMAQLSFSSWWYNCILSYYFLLTVISQVRRKNFVKKWEPWLHFSGTFFLVTSIMGLRRGWYMEIGGCYIYDTTIKWIVAGGPTLFIYLSLIINNIVIYVLVRRSLQSSGHVASLTSVQKRLRREAATMMFLYVAGFFVTVSPVFIQQILDIYFDHTYLDDVKLYPLTVLDSILRPLQGFINFFIYIKPMYTRFQITNPNKSTRFVLHQVLFNTNVPQMTYSTNVSIDIAEEDGANPNRALFNSNFRPRNSSSDSSSSSESSSEGGNSDINSEEDAKEEE